MTLNSESKCQGRDKKPTHEIELSPSLLGRRFRYRWTDVTQWDNNVKYGTTPDSVTKVPGEKCHDCQSTIHDAPNETTFRDSLSWARCEQPFTVSIVAVDDVEFKNRSEALLYRKSVLRVERVRERWHWDLRLVRFVIALWIDDVHLVATLFEALAPGPRPESCKSPRRYWGNNYR